MSGSFLYPYPALPGAASQDQARNSGTAWAELTVDESGGRKPVTRTPLPSSDHQLVIRRNLREDCLLYVSPDNIL